jgi:hypothetical protein
MNAMTDMDDMGGNMNEAPAPAASVTFPAPSGFDTSDMKLGASKDVLCSLKLNEGGQLELVAVNGVPLGGSEEPPQSTEAPPEEAPAGKRQSPGDRFMKQFRPETQP